MAVGNFSRRDFCAMAAAVAAPRRKAVLLRSGWQLVNIGDVAHAPGMLGVLSKNLPDAEIIFWPAHMDDGVERMIRRGFPQLRIVQTASEVEQAFRDAALFIHGSAPSVISTAQVLAWKQKTGKPYGFYGVTVSLSGEAASPALDPHIRDLLMGARFVYTRDTFSLANLKKVGIQGPEMGFTPDGTFGFHLLNEEAGLRFLKESALEPKRFIAIVPRLRYTPYHKIRKVSWSAEEIKRREAVNEKHAEADHAKLRTVAEAFIRKTGGKVLFCPEMTYQIDIIDPLLYDPLPADVKKHVVRRKTFWRPDEAASVYKRAMAVVSCECHSPIIAATQHTPCMYLHQPEDGIKGQMWRDLGLDEWYFPIEETRGETVAERVLAIHADYAAADRKIRAALDRAHKRQAETMAYVRRILETT